MTRSLAGSKSVGAAVLTVALALSGPYYVWAGAPEQSSGQSDQAVQDRAVPMQRSGIMNVPTFKGPRTPLPPKGGTMAFQCNMTSCTCRGDNDCNNMFSSSVCGSSAVCDTTNGTECSCLRHQ